MSAPEQLAGVYVHVPFCTRACPYCDFDFEVYGGPDPDKNARAQLWLDGLADEWQRRRSEIGEYDTLYIGGGTPSVLSLEHMRALLSRFDVGGLRECTVELNPEHVTPAYLDMLLACGVDRVSLGVQSLTAAGLRALGRVHTGAQARACVQDCVARGLRTSADLIVGWPGHDAATLADELRELVALGVEHLSIYALTIESDTPWPKLVRRGLRVMPDDDTQAELLLAAERQLLAAGFVHYEVASYARPGSVETGSEAVHNAKYWRFCDVIGLGPSAASVRHVQGAVERRTNPRGISAWLSNAPEYERLEGERAAAEALWLGLRRLGGMDVDAYLGRFFVDRPWLERRIARQLALGNLCWSADGSRLAVAPDRWLWHDSIAIDLL